MALSPPALEALIKVQLLSALIEVFGPSPDPASHKDLAEAIAKGISTPIINHLLTAQVIVNPGIATAGSPAAQVTTSPGTGTLV